MRAANSLAVRLKDGGYRIAAVEKELRRNALGVELEGRLDLLLDPTAVVDLKWSGRTYRRDGLEAGTALQLAAYAFLASGPGNGTTLPPVGYFILKRQEMLALRSGPI